MTGGKAADAAVASCGLLMLAFLVFFLGGWGDGAFRGAVGDSVNIPVAALFAALAVGVVRHRGLDRRSRRAWSFIAAAYVCRLVAQVSWLIEIDVLHSTRYPTFADYWFLAFIPFLLAGLVLLPGAPRTRAMRVKLALDALIVGASAYMVLWYVVLGPIVVDETATLSGIVFAAALPVGDLLLILALATLLMRRPAATEPGVRLLAGAAGTFVVADTYYGWSQLHAGFTGGHWADLFYLTGCYLLVLGTHRRYRAVTAATAPRRPQASAVNWLPYGAIALGYGLLAYIAHDLGVYPLGGMIIGAILLTSLVVARQMYALRENRQLAVADPLTGLANRALVGERLTRMTTRAARADRHGAVLLIDLDHFKPINDLYGHEAGDAVLRAVAAALRAVVRAGDTAGRLGGDEFAVIMPNLPSRETAEGVAQRLVEALRTPVIFGEHLLSVGASVGLAIRDDEPADAEQLLQQADTAMYAAKRAGRGRYQIYTPEMDLRARDAELRQAVEDGQLVVHYQPAVDLATENIVAVEALVRWRHPTRGLLPPGAFIAIAEETGAVVPIGAWVLREACRQVASWRRDVPGAEDLRLSVNLSPNQVTQPDLVDVLRDILAETGFPARRLVLELTEGVILQPEPEVVRRLEQVRELGVRIAVDDFGTGYSALSYLRLLPVDILKIDRSFVTGIAEDTEACTVAEAVIRLGMAFRMLVVAEGIETAEQAQVLLDLGCEFGQGFHFHRPLEAAGAAAALRTAIVR